MSDEPPASSKGKDWHLIVAIIGVIVAIVVPLVIYQLSKPKSPALGPVPSSTAPIPSEASAPVPSPTSASAPSPTQTPTVSTPPAEPADEAEIYVDDYVQECRLDVLTAGSASINGANYAHTILQWAGDTSEPVTIKRKAVRFKATVGIRDDASDQVR
jgi:hypothetical protein